MNDIQLIVKLPLMIGGHKKPPVHEVILYICKELNSLGGYKMPQISLLFEFELHIYYAALQNNYV